MRHPRTFRLFALALLGLAALSCSRPTAPPPSAPDPVAPARPPVHPAPEPREKPSHPAAPEVQFRLYRGLPGFFDPATAQVLQGGDSAVVDTGLVELDILLPGVAEAAAREAVIVTGGTPVGEPQWYQDGRLRLRFAAGNAGEQITVAVRLSGAARSSITLTRAAPATVTVDQRYGDGWQPVTIMTAYAPPGPTTVRLLFSKPVRRSEVEEALTTAQSTPVRGLMEWENDRTLIWHINELPARLDFLLGDARDQDGLSLPGGIPSLRRGDPSVLVAVDIATAQESPLLTLPPDIISAGLTPDGEHLNLMVWSPGRNRWDWKSMDLYAHLPTQALRQGRVDSVQVRLSREIENWVLNPSGTAVAGLRTARPAAGSEAAASDLVIMDLRGGREQSVPAFAGRYIDPEGGALTAHVAWSYDGLRIAGLSYAGGDPQHSDLVVAELPGGPVTSLLEGLPVPAAGTRLAWSPDQRWMLAGNLLVDLETGQALQLPGAPEHARGAWQPDATRLLYSQGAWGPLFLVEPSAHSVTPLGDGLLVGWSGEGSAYIIRWPGSDARYFPPGW